MFIRLTSYNRDKNQGQTCIVSLDTLNSIRALSSMDAEKYEAAMDHGFLTILNFDEGSLIVKESLDSISNMLYSCNLLAY